MPSLATSAKLCRVGTQRERHWLWAGRVWARASWGTKLLSSCKAWKEAGLLSAKAFSVFKSSGSCCKDRSRESSSQGPCFNNVFIHAFFLDLSFSLILHDFQGSSFIFTTARRSRSQSAPIQGLSWSSLSQKLRHSMPALQAPAASRQPAGSSLMRFSSKKMLQSPPTTPLDL